MEIQQELLQRCLRIDINGICLKPLTKYLKLISKKWMILIIMVFPTEYDDSSSEPIKTISLRYSEIKSRIKEITSQKISDTTLSSRLNELDDNRIVYREQFNQIPPRVEYQLSSKGIELRNSLQPLIEWAIKDCHEA